MQQIQVSEVDDMFFRVNITLLIECFCKRQLLFSITQFAVDASKCQNICVFRIGLDQFFENNQHIREIFKLPVNNTQQQ